MKQLFRLVLLVPFWLQSQNTSFQIPDSIQHKDFRYLEDRIYQFRNDSARAALYLFSYVKKAKRERNWRELQNGYQSLLHQSPPALRLVYADSMVYAAKKTSDDAAIGAAFLTKGIVFYAQKKYKEALDDYLIANEYIARTNDYYLIYKVKYNMALLKSYSGFYEEAISLLRECVSYYKKKHDGAYLNSLHSLGLSYNKVGNYGLCSQTNAEGIRESEKRAVPEMTSYFKHSEGVNQYFLKNYQQSIDYLKNTVAVLENNDDFANEAVGNFYIGKSYWALKKHETAIPYFTKVDQILNSRQFTRRDLLESYQLLIHYYKAKDNAKLHLYYIDQLFKADRLLHETNLYLVSKVNKEYDNKTHIIEKQKLEHLIDKGKYNDIIFIAIVTLLFMILLFLGYRDFKNKSMYKKKFEALMDKNGEAKKETTKIPHSGIADINPTVAAELIKQLEKWEKDKKFLDQDISLVKLAASFNSNTKYLSLIVYHYRHKKFVTYVNELKIDYLIQALEENKQLRQYNQKALAEEIGFSSIQRFAHAFRARTEMPASYFMAQLRKEETTSGLQTKTAL
ncbi:helix-turn-helix domain-containing protein [Flavobacterium granuli]|uniref:AraC-like DNA-binding protein n=1 Tax=Flavobacterium granuli TaxID=280093 RepID=A0A1M5R1I8_9FLAO|nr:helix-turn-helix domain-containing protein [Flavobacterium granuli]PRZ21564.1 AraC-like DNA-binding protein [Flavobacterium granuli]SHH19829.1 AraC-type DNA-binding protein [Flavobacterium granuli]